VASLSRSTDKVVGYSGIVPDVPRESEAGQDTFLYLRARVPRFEDGIIERARRKFIRYEYMLRSNSLFASNEARAGNIGGNRRGDRGTRELAETDIFPWLIRGEFPHENSALTTIAGRRSAR